MMSALREGGVGQNMTIVLIGYEWDSDKEGGGPKKPEKLADVIDVWPQAKYAFLARSAASPHKRRQGRTHLFATPQPVLLL